MFANLKAVGVGSLGASLFGLFGTAFLARVIMLSEPLRLATVSRQLTSPLAMSCASMLNADVSLAVAMVRLCVVVRFVVVVAVVVVVVAAAAVVAVVVVAVFVVVFVAVVVIVAVVVVLSVLSRAHSHILYAHARTGHTRGVPPSALGGGDGASRGQFWHQASGLPWSQEPGQPWPGDGSFCPRVGGWVHVCMCVYV